ncbi:hypothetical protein X011_11635 [Mycobacterium tuberculosis variant microti OV254]|nr:hypothetical protein X011_11635 [Mycobacterium tuberculosis variant microti OV254]
MTPEVAQGPRCSIGCTGPAAPLGGGVAGSITGAVIADADGQAHGTTTGTKTKAALSQADPARIID